MINRPILGCAVASFCVSGIICRLVVIQMPGHNDIRVELEGMQSVDPNPPSWIRNWLQK